MTIDVVLDGLYYFCCNMCGKAQHFEDARTAVEYIHKQGRQCTVCLSRGDKEVEGT